MLLLILVRHYPFNSVPKKRGMTLNLTSAAEFVYTTLFRPIWIRTFINRIILKIIPTSVRIGNAVIMINPKDPIHSAALTFGVYEKFEIELMSKICSTGKVVVDIGAHVGLYTAIAGLGVGPSGRVFALEPDPVSFNYLQQTVKANKLANIQLVQAAASNKNDRSQLFASSTNRGDTRMYNNNNADCVIQVETLKLDDYFDTQKISTIDIIKMDIQGFEGHAIEGMKEIIRRSPRLIILMEFWPTGLTSAGTDPIELLQQLENMGLKLYEIKKQKNIIPIIDKKLLVSQLHGRRYANIVLLGSQADGSLLGLK